jgi:hypothetical protein
MNVLARFSAVIALVSLSFTSSGCAAHDRTRARAVTPIAQLDSEDHCRLASDPTALKICRAEKRLRKARRQPEKGRIECFDERVGQMHAADRERSRVNAGVRDRYAFGFDQAPSAERLMASERRVSELWDQIQSGVCDSL